jgi:ABC-type transport system involved in multi-copper enzyme maturation permease subunit
MGARPGNVKGYTLMYKIITNGGITVFECISIVFVALFIASGFKQGNIRSEISFGYRRTEIYFSKLLSAIIGSGLIMVSTLMTGLAAGTAFFGLGSDFNSDIFVQLIRSFYLIILVSMAFSSIYVLICFIFKEPGIITGVFIGFIVLINNLLVAQLSMRFEWFKKITEYFLEAQMYSVASPTISGKNALSAVAYTLAVIAVSSFIGCKLFKRMDIA